LAPSGSGKSTLLRCINRLEEYDEGRIVVEDIPLDSAENINTVRREIGIVFQSFNLFSHLTVVENLTLAQRVVRKRSTDESQKITLELLEKWKFQTKPKPIGVPPFFVPPIMRDFLPLALIVQLLLLDSFRSIFWQTRPELGNPASCADGSYCTPASSFSQ